MRKAILALLATFAEMERSLIRERAKQRMKRARESKANTSVDYNPRFLEIKILNLLKQGKTIKDV